MNLTPREKDKFARRPWRPFVARRRLDARRQAQPSRGGALITDFVVRRPRRAGPLPS